MAAYISKIRLVNFRLFQKAELELHPELCVFLGDNGSGKTAILDALSMLISSIFPYCNYQPKIKAIPYAFHNFRTWSERLNGRRMLKQADVSGIVGVMAHSWKNGDEEITQWLALSIGQKISTEEDVSIPTTKVDIASLYNFCVETGKGIPAFAHYGPHRGAEQGDRKRFKRKKVNYTNPFSAYINSLQPSLDFDAFLDWFSEEESSELREQRKNKQYISKELNAVRKALAQAFSSTERRCSDPRFESNPKRFVMTETSASGKPLELDFDQLSDGYRGMIALVADFARRLAITNQYTEADPLLGEGVLIIDEIDAHLHPRWQYRVIDDLRRTFPNVQLIVTTHSPEVVSTVNKDSVYILNAEEGVLQEEHPEHQTAANYPEKIAATVMDVPDMIRNHPAFKAYLYCLTAIQSGNVDSPCFVKKRNEVISHYGENHPLTREIDARNEGLSRKKELLAKLKGQASE